MNEANVTLKIRSFENCLLQLALGVSRISVLVRVCAFVCSKFVFVVCRFRSLKFLKDLLVTSGSTQMFENILFNSSYLDNCKITLSLVSCACLQLH